MIEPNIQTQDGHLYGIKVKTLLSADNQVLIANSGNQH